MTEHPYWVAIQHQSLMAFWRSIVGEGPALLPVRSPVPILATLDPGRVSRVPVYVLQPQALPMEQRRLLLEYLSRRYNVSPGQAAIRIDSRGLPIRATACALIH